MKRFFRIIAAVIGAAAFSLLIGTMVLAHMVPDTYSVVEGRTFSLPSEWELHAVGRSGNKAVAANAQLRAGNIYSTSLELFGVVPVKTVTVHVVRETDVIPSGQPFGVKLYTQGVVIVGMSDVDTAGGPINPAYNAGIRVGDIIMAINGRTVNSNSDVAEAFEKSGGKPLKISAKRDGVAYAVNVTPVKSAAENVYKAGMWVRDSTAGIGTLTFFSPDSGVFAGLGHAICDVDTGEVMPLQEGDIVRVAINGVSKGEKGQPGELKGYFMRGSNWGRLFSNTDTGVFGMLQSLPTGNAVPVAMKQQVHEGSASILCTLDGATPKAYSVVIERVHFNDTSDTKNMIVRVTDPTLLAATGGIVQGMSGSPILQDGRLAGAVTHVFINDPTRGYGIFAENMLKTLQNAESAQAEKAS